jgi:hypothetical protein
VENVNSALSPAQLDAAIDAMYAVIKARLDALNEGPYPKGKTEKTPAKEDKTIQDAKDKTIQDAKDKTIQDAKDKYGLDY